MKKFLSLLLALFMVFALVGCSSGSTSTGSIATITKEENKAAGKYAGKTLILHTNDMHGGFLDSSDNDGGLEGYAAVAAAKKHFEDWGATVILVDNGEIADKGTYDELIERDNGFLDMLK